MKFEIIFLGLIVLIARADYIYAYSKPLQLIPATSYATTSSYYIPGQATISSFTKTAPIMQSTQPTLQSTVAPTLIQAQSYIQPVNTMSATATRFGLTQGTNAFSTSSSSSFSSYPTLAPTMIPTPTPTSVSTLIPTPTLIPAPVTPVDQISTPTYLSSFSPTNSLQVSTNQLPQSLTQPIPTQIVYSNSLNSQVPNYSTSNSILGTSNAISGINNSGSGNNNLISGTNNCLTGDSNFLLGGSNLISGSSNTVMGNQNCVTGSSNTVMGLPSSLTTNNLVMGPEVVASGTLPPSPVDSALFV